MLRPGPRLRPGRPRLRPGPRLRPSEGDNCIYIYIYIMCILYYIYIYICMYVYMYYGYIYIYIHICIFIFIFIYVYIHILHKHLGKWTDGVSTNGVTANVMFFVDRGTFWVLPVNLLLSPQKCLGVKHLSATKARAPAPATTRAAPATTRAPAT